MKLEVTEQDKKLLSILAGLVIFAAILFLGAIPLHKRNKDMKAAAESIQEAVEENQRKLVALAQMEIVKEENQKQLEAVQEKLYPMMESQEIDRILTEMAFAHGLTVRKLEIQMPMEESKLLAFQENGNGMGGKMPEEKADGVFQAQVLLEVTGSKEGKAGLLDEIAEEHVSIRTLTMRRIRQMVRGAAEGEEHEMEVLELRLEVSMCRKVGQDGSAHR